MGLAAFGVVLAIFHLVKKRFLAIPSDIFALIFFAGFVSMVGVFSVIYNNTPDFAYATYIISMVVWLSAAYVVCCLSHHQSQSCYGEPGDSA